MKCPTRKTTIFLACSVLAVLWGSAQAGAKNAAAHDPKTAAPVARLAPAHAPAQPVARQADAALKAMGNFIGSAGAFSFRADVTFDHVLPSGQKLQFSAQQDVVAERPGRLRVDWSGDLGARRFWYDGKSITLYDPAQPFYATASAPAQLDGMLDLLIGKYGFSPPLADFLYRDPYKTLRQNIQYGFDLGDSEVAGRSCRSFAFVEKKIDWQIWIEDSAQPVPCKVTITYKTNPAQPQFTAVFSDWKFAPRISEATFSPDVPAGIERIGFADLSNTKLALGGPQ
jgi:hypothetical protein